MSDKDILTGSSWGFKRDTEEVPRYEVPPDPDFLRDDFSESTDTSFQEENFVDELLPSFFPEDEVSEDEVREEVKICRDGVLIRGLIPFQEIGEEEEE